VQDSEHLFRREAGRMIASLTRIFGVRNLDLAEDVVQDAFCRALDTWKLRGMPDDPSAWLQRVAKNRAIDALRRERTARSFEPQLARLFESEWTLVPAIAELFSESTVEDDQLRMMFSCCHPRLAEHAQVALVLNLLCGFSAGEVAAGFLSPRSAIEKRIVRGKKVLASSAALFDLRAGDLRVRLQSVQRALYLLFNEGYHGASPSKAVRTELCHEAMRLVALLRTNPLTATPATFALGALMCLNAARLHARIDAQGNLSTLYDQDRSLWDRRLLARGQELLEQSAVGTELSEFHVEAAIAAAHTRAGCVEETDWRQIVDLYDMLLRLRPSPVVALNRAIAIGQLEGPQRGLDEIRAIAQQERLADYPFYNAALGELELRTGRAERAREHFAAALAVARNPMERNFLTRRMAAAADR
jgi:RNA polymerase sigma factor (sigma-70 family)